MTILTCSIDECDVSVLVDNPLPVIKKLILSAYDSYLQPGDAVEEVEIFLAFRRMVQIFNGGGLAMISPAFVEDERVAPCITTSLESPDKYVEAVIEMARKATLVITPVVPPVRLTLRLHLKCRYQP